ncbi:hypothetical protein [Ktedonobacter sp. SOSP1-52]|uniref:hypothetical protein n=1 Tax=Ktedonobacter sp. SOSP1-52 TaxID=2778366 RepID=UPI001915B892|nr:hypothetical protein [Ktedonobacter sp. SOSP1-52]
MKGVILSENVTTIFIMWTTRADDSSSFGTESLLLKEWRTSSFIEKEEVPNGIIDHG